MTDPHESAHFRAAVEALTAGVGIPELVAPRLLAALPHLRRMMASEIRKEGAQYPQCAHTLNDVADSIERGPDGEA